MPLTIGRVSGVMGPVPARPRAPDPEQRPAAELSELELLTDPLRAETARPAAAPSAPKADPPDPDPDPGPPLATHCECLHAALLVCRADLSENDSL